VAHQPGVTAVDINYATRRRAVRWDERRIKLSDILAAIQAIGYRAIPTTPPARADFPARAPVCPVAPVRGRLRHDAGDDVRLPAYIADGEMTADIEAMMRWASLILTAPVVLYSAAPFFSHAFRDVRLRRLGMDVPVALGIGAAFIASCWATFTGRARCISTR
jgi:Cu2+-exporting ATPase